jgi:hypothetical protein
MPCSNMPAAAFTAAGSFKDCPAVETVSAILSAILSVVLTKGARGTAGGIRHDIFVRVQWATGGSLWS